MPRHDHPTTRDHVYVPHDERPPHFEPRNVWVIDNYRVGRWYYRAAPTIGDMVRYMDGTHTIVTNVTATKIVLGNALTMRRPYPASRLLAWVLPRLAHVHAGLGAALPAKRTRSAPNRVTIYV